MHKLRTPYQRWGDLDQQFSARPECDFCRFESGTTREDQRKSGLQLGTLANQSNATVRLTLNTTSFTGPVTNLIQVRRNELERYTRNDSAVVVTQVNPVPTISINDIIIDEGSAGTTNAIFTVRLSLPSSQTVSVNYRDVKGTADESDYRPSAAC